MKITGKKMAIIAGRDPVFKNDTDGGSVFLEYLMKELLKRGCLVDIFTPFGITGGNYNKEKAKKQRSTQKYRNDKNLHRCYFPISAIASHKMFKIKNYFLKRIELSKAITSFFRDKKLYRYDVIYILHVANAFFLAKENLLPISKTILFPMMTSAHYRLFSKVPLRYISLEKETLMKMKHICSPSKDEINSIISGFGISKNKFFKINRGFDEKEFAPKGNKKNSPLGHINLFSANGIRPQKDHLFLVPVVKLLIKQGFKIKVRLTGNNGKSHNPDYNSYAKNFWRIVINNSLEKNFIAYGVISRNRMTSIMRSSDIAVYPSISETFGKSALESMVIGLPTIVCDDVPAFKEFIQHGKTGSIVPRKVEKFAEEIIKLATNPAYYKTINEKGVSLRSKFCWGKIINELILKQFKRKII